MSEGQFHCPQCEANQKYKHKKVRRFFTLYFIPLIPMGKIGEFVECQACRGTFIPKVLDYKKSASADKFLSEYEKAMKHAMVLIMLADGEIDDNEMLTVQRIVNKLGHNDISLDDLKQYVAEVQQNPEDISTYLKKVTPALNEHGKEMVIRCAFQVASADGNVDDSEVKLISKMAETMEMSSAHLKGILDELYQLKDTFSAN
jgi:uncharacterized tellurite resistance protein B-like protein